MIGLFGFPRPSGFSMAMAPKYRPIFLGSMIRKRWINQSIQSLYRWHAALRPRRGVDLAQWSDAPRSLGFRGVGRRCSSASVPAEGAERGRQRWPGTEPPGVPPPPEGVGESHELPGVGGRGPPPEAPPRRPPGAQAPTQTWQRPLPFRFCAPATHAKNSTFC